MKWEMVELIEVADVIAGQSPPSSSYNNEGKGLPFFQGKADFGYLYPSIRYWCTEPKKKAEVGDILISVRAPVGPTNLCNIDACIGRGLSAIRVKKDVLVNKYLLHFLRYFEPRIASKANGSTFTAITQSELKKIKIPLPPLTEQKRIAQLLDTADALRQKDKALLAGYDELLESIFLEMFGDVGGNPNGWKTNLLNDLVEIQSGLIDPRKLPYSNMPHIGGNNIESNTGDFLDLRPAHELNLISGKYYFDQEYILYNKIRPYLNKVAMPNFEGICSADMYPIKPKNTTNKYYIFKVLTSDFFLSFAGKHSRRASIPKINRKDLLSFNVPTPPISLQNKFAEIVQNIEAQKDKVRLQLKESEDLFGALMQEVFG